MPATYSADLLKSQHQDVVTWMTERAQRGNDFAESVLGFLNRKGYLTEGQFNAVKRNVDRAAEQRSASAQAPEVSLVELEKVFGVALGNGLKTPRLTVGPYRFNPAGTASANPGAIYVKRVEDGEYLGKMMNGRFLAKITGEYVQEILNIARDPKGEAIKHGHLTGRCAICSRKLSDSESTARGMGPVCAAKYGW